MDLGEVRDTMRILLGTRDSSNQWTDAVLTTIINMAQKQIWRRIAGYSRDLCATSARVTYSADALVLDLETGITGTPNINSILSVYAVLQDADPSTSNPPYPLRPIALADLDSTRFGGDPAVTALADYTLQSAQFRYAMSGRSINVRPIPSRDLFLWVRYIAVPTDLSASSDDVFGGELVDLHDAVLYRALMMAAVRSKETPDGYAELERTAWDDGLATLETQSQEPLPPRSVTSY